MTPDQCLRHLNSLIRTKQYQKAEQYIFGHIREYQNQEFFVILYILFQIRSEELEHGCPDIISSFDAADAVIDILLAHYRQIKLLLRRFEYDLPPESRQEAIEYFTDFSVSPYALYRIGDFACIDKKHTYHNLAEAYHMAGNDAMSDIFQNAFADKEL